jgi:mRNA interferase RelE/StbE
MPYAIRYMPQALAALDVMPDRIRRAVVKKIDTLADNPRPPSCTKLFWRIRQGDYRILYSVDGTTVVIEGVTNRREAYTLKGRRSRGG